MRFDRLTACVRSTLTVGAALSALLMAPSAMAQSSVAAPVAVTAAPEGSGPALWVIKDADSTSYLVGRAAHIRILRYAIASCYLHTGDLRVVCVESGEINVIAQSAAVQLCKQHALANRFSGGADHGACLRSVLVPCQHRAEVKLCFRQVFICFAGVSGFFALVALVGIRVRADGGVGQDFLLGLRFRLLLRLGVLPLFCLVFRFLRIGLLLLAGQLAVGAAAGTGCAGAFGFAVSGMTGRLSRLQDGDLLRCGLQDGIFRLG